MARLEIVPFLCICIATGVLSEASLPKIAVIYTSQHSALVSWQDTDTSSDEYIVEYGTDWQHSKTLRVSRKTNTAMIHSLSPNTLYTVRVKNATKSHPGPSISFRTKSAAVSFFAPLVTVKSRGDNKLLITWRLPPMMRPSDVVHFSLIFSPLYSPYFRETSLVLPGHYRSFVLEYLRPSTVYKVKLAALLRLRKGPFSAWVMEKTGGEISSVDGSQSTLSPIRYITRKGVDHVTQATDLPRVTTQKQPATQTTNEDKNDPTMPQFTSTPTSIDGNTPTSLPTTGQQYKETSEETTTTTTSLNHEPTAAVRTSVKGLAPTREVITDIQENGQQKASTSQQPTAFTRKMTSAATTLIISGTLPRVSDGGACEVIQPSMCSDNGYQTTKLRFNDQKRVNRHVENTWSRLSSICKSQEILKQFICAVNFPFCSIQHGGPFLPCRSMCISAKHSCGLENSADWPSELECENFPTVRDSKICIAFGHNAAAAIPTTSPIMLVTSPYIDSTTHPSKATLQSNELRTTSDPTTKYNPITATARNRVAKTTRKTIIDDVTRKPSTQRDSLSPVTSRTSATSAPLTFTQTPGNSVHSSVGQIKTADPPTVLTSPPVNCEPLTLTICNGAGYNMVQFPNYFNQTHQNDAARGLTRYWPLVEIECSSKFVLFLCSLYTPVCTRSLPRGEGTGQLSNIPPCRSVCEQVSRECGALMKIYDIIWPDGVDCQKFPEEGDKTCLHGNTDVTDSRDLVTFSKSVKQSHSPSKKIDINGCQEIPVDHVCKNHYVLGALSNTSKSFNSVDIAIRNRIALVKDSASKKCVRHLELFMCSMYIPKCSKEYHHQPPCRSQCKTTLRRCDGALKALDIFIPELNKCRQFPHTHCTAHRRKHGKKKKKLEIESL